MSLKFKITLILVLMLAAYAFGRYSVPEKIVTVTKTVTVEKEVIRTDINKKDHKVVYIVQKPDGTKTTTIVDDSDTTNKTAIDKSTDKTTLDSSETIYSTSKITISVLGGMRPFEQFSPPVYGAAITRPILGPITVGIWGLSDKTFGASVGLTF